MDRDGIARRLRRAEALEALEFERDREASLRKQLERTILETETARIDREAYGRMEPADAALARDALGVEPDPDPDDPDEAWETWDDDVAADEEDDTEAEIARLDGAIADARARQHALERFIDALGA